MNWRTFWPKAELKRERELHITAERDRDTLSTALRNATDRAALLQSRLDEVIAKPCPNCETLKQVVNFHVIAAGSRAPMFDGYGPIPPPRKEIDLSKLPHGPQRASRMARMQNNKFLSEMMPDLLKKEQEFQDSLEQALQHPLSEESVAG